MPNRERQIENAVMQAPEILNPAYRGADAVRNVRIHPNKRSGRVDVLLLPQTGPHKIALVESKVFNASDADSKCVGQLLKYFAFGLKIGDHAVRKIRQYATDHQDLAQNEKKTTPKQILRVEHESDCLECWMGGNFLRPSEIGLYVALDGTAHGALPQITETLHEQFGLEIDIAILQDGQLALMQPRDRK